MKIYTYHNESVEESTIKSIQKSRKTTWIRSINPSEEEIKDLSIISSAPMADFKEFLDEDERPRIFVEKYLQVIYRTPYKDDDEVRTVPLNIYIYKNIIVTVEKVNTRVLNNIEGLILQKRARFLFRGSPFKFLTYLLDQINDLFVRNIDSISDNLEIFQEHPNLQKRNTPDKIYSTSVTLTFFNQALLANLEVLNSLRKSYYKPIGEREKVQFSELYYDGLQILDREKIQREVISNLFNLQSVIASNKLNNFIKRLTILAIIIAVPTLVSGIYGMNFDHIPLSSNPFGFYLILLLMFITTSIIVLAIQKLD